MTMSKISKKVMKKDMTTERVHEYQNLNSGNLLAKGLTKMSWDCCQFKKNCKPIFIGVFGRQSNVNIVFLRIKLN